jgi:shikimate kinase
LNTIFISSVLVTLEKRITKEEVLKRPMLSEHSIKDLFNLRNGIYKEVTKQIVYNNNENVNEVVSQLEDIVRRKKI